MTDFAIGDNDLSMDESELHIQEDPDCIARELEFKLRDWGFTGPFDVQVTDSTVTVCSTEEGITVSQSY